MYEKKRDVIFNEGISTELCEKFIQYKRGMGQKFPRSNQYNLLNLSRVLNNLEISKPILSKEVVETMAARRLGESLATQVKRVRLLRQFAVFMSIMGFEAYIYPKHSMPQNKYDFRPYLFSPEQIASIIKAADEIIPNNKSPKAHLVYPAIIRTIYGCGLRSGEALKLKAYNVNLKDGILLIEKSKRNTSRYVPMSETLTCYCRRYALAMNILSNSTGYFFPSPDGGHYHEFTLQDR